MTNKEKLDEAIKEAKEKNSKELAFMKTDLAERFRNIVPYLNEIADLVQEIGYRIIYLNEQMHTIAKRIDELYDKKEDILSKKGDNEW